MTGHAELADEVLDADQRRARLADVPDWRYTLSSLYAVYEAATVTDALGFIQEVGAAAESVEHHPDLDWRYKHVFLRSTSHSHDDQVTGKDFVLASAVSAAAARLELQPRPELIRVIELAIDAVDPAAVADTWASALGYRRSHDGELADPWSRLPTVWFQQTPTPDPSRIHVDLIVEDSTADAVLAEITAHGGLRIDDTYRPSFTVVADADGNRLCVCTNLGRD